MSRRNFLKTTAALTTLAAPYYVSASAFGKNSPSNRINVGCIGVGNQGFPNMLRFLNQGDCQVVAVCDVNRGSHGYKEPGDFYGREPAKQEVERYYAEQKSVGRYKGCEAYSDFRELLARDDIDAVMLAPPDHWHEAMTIAAAVAGKDIYCEKPLGLTIGGQQKMIEAVRKHERILQTGSHERSNPLVRQALELVRSGTIGDVKRVAAFVGRHNKVGPGPGWQPMPVPDGFDYDRWLGPAPEAPYHEDRCLYNFRFNYDYAGGQITNFGAHSIDMAQWGLGMDDTGPTQVEYIYADYLPKGSLFNAATHTFFRCKYKNGAVLECITAEPSVRCIFEGTEGVVRIDNMGQNFVVVPETLKPKPVIDAEKYHSGDDHVRNFLECIKSRSEPAAPVEMGHRTATVCHLGNIAIQLKATLKWDPKAERFIGDKSDDANVLLNRKSRNAWEA
ncbi:MAG: Gfo/Idh/MocA family oxidoreductase [Pirellulales bacterium]